MRNLLFVLPAMLAATTIVPAQAATISRTETTLSSAACQPALGAFHQAIRARPAAMKNESGSSAYITCGLRSVRGNQRYIRQAGVYLRNEGSVQRSVQCTLVDVGTDFANPTYHPKTLVLAAGQPPTLLAWNQSDNGGLAYRYPAVSCALPPDTGVGAVLRVFDEEIGQ